LIERLLCFCGWDVADGAEQPGVVIPIDPFEGFSFDLAHRFPRTNQVDDLGFEQADQNLLGLTQLAVLAFKLFDTSLLSTGRSRPLATITLGLMHPIAKTVWRTAQFAEDRSMRCCVASLFVAVLRNTPHRRFAELGRIRLRGLLSILFHDGQIPKSFALR
jgi:hypothetical protein